MIARYLEMTRFSAELRFMGNPMPSRAFFSCEMISGMYLSILRGHFF
jgi:hypothetical protein